MDGRARRGDVRNPYLTVQAIAGETAWLTGRLGWQDGRIVWQTDKGSVQPQPGDLALAQRRLYQVRRYPLAARRVLGDVDQWLAARQAALELAKRLQPLRAPDLASLGAARPANPSARLDRLVDLLLAEALCVEPLPGSPSTSLLSYPATVVASATARLWDQTLPPSVWALVALLNGAAAQTTAGTLPAAAQRLTNDRQLDQWLRRAFNWGQRYGLSADPVLTVRLLASDDGTSLATRCWELLRSSSQFRPSVRLLRILLADGCLPPTVVAIGECLVGAETLATLPRHHQTLPKHLPQRHRHAVALNRRRQYARLIAQLVEPLHDLARMTPAPAVLSQAIAWATIVLSQTIVSTLAIPDQARTTSSQAALSPSAAEYITMVWRDCHTLNSTIQGTYLAWLIERATPLLKLPKRASSAAEIIAQWLAQRLTEHHDMMIMLSYGVDLSTVTFFTEYPVLLRYLVLNPVGDPAFYTWLAAHFKRDSQDVSLNDYSYAIVNLADHVGASREAFRSVRHFLQALERCQVSYRSSIISDVVYCAPPGRGGLRQSLAQVAPAIPRLQRFFEEDFHHELLSRALIMARIALDESMPNETADLFDWLTTRLTLSAEHRQQGHLSVAPDSDTLTMIVALAPALAIGQPGHYRAIVELALTHTFEQPIQAVRAGTRVLRSHRALCLPLARLILEQPQRCLTLVARLGLTERLAVAHRAPLANLSLTPTGSAADVDDDPDWVSLLTLDPSMAELAQQYRHACQLAGEPATLPVGVRHAVELPQRLATEVAFLVRRVAEQPAQPHLAIRLASLQTRLAAPEQLLANCLTEARERLDQATRLTQLAVVEERVTACFLLRLEQITGPLPPGRRLDDDLLNAILLSIDVRSNRRLLMALLRADLKGHTRWRENHPANQSFLQRLEAAGVDTTLWLSARPRRFACPGVAGEQLHLAMEQRPLRILQMGNLFDTCLSFGGINSFSTVANACELNKRVIYASDGHGRIVARKLIGVTTEHQLIGYYTYTTVAETARERVQAIISRYCRDLAAAAGISLAHEGTLPTLFATAWYDDGARHWDDHLAPPPSRVSLSRQQVGSNQISAG